MKVKYQWLDDERWFCDRCGMVVQEEDVVCWHCKDSFEEEE